jgi:hypothetical protein
MLTLTSFVSITYINKVAIKEDTMTVIRPSIQTTIPATRSSASKKSPLIDHEPQEELLPPPSRGFRFIPEDSVLDALIKKAVNALKKGIYWDRGSILNIEV